MCVDRLITTMSRRSTTGSGSGHRIGRRGWLAALGLGGVAGLAGCSGDGSQESDGGTDGSDSGSDADGSGGSDDGVELDGEIPDVSGTYDTVTAASFETLNPLYNTESGAGTAIGRALDSGYTFDADQELFPLLYDLSSDDGMVWVFELRDGLRFSDPYGDVTADDFVYQIQELHQSDWANTANAGDWEGVTVERTGELEFQAELENPNPLWPESFAPLEYPIPRGLVEPYVDEEDVEGLRQDEELLELGFTGNLGPFVLDEWNRGAGTQYSRNDEYYVQDIDEGPTLFESAPYFEGASISVVEEQASRLGALEAGEADAASIPPERFEEYAEDDAVQVRQIPQPFNEILSANMRDNGWNAGPGNLFRHTAFRRALAAAISKDELIQGVYRGLAEPHFTWQPRFSEFYPGDDSIPQFGTGDRYGSEVARSLAEDAFGASEFAYGFDGEDMVTPEGDPVALDLYYGAGQEVEGLIAEFVAQELGENLGIDVTVESIDPIRFVEGYWTAQPQGGTETIDGEEVEWSTPTPNNPGPRSVTSEESWDLSLVVGLNTYPRNPLTNTAFFDGPNARYNPVGYYPEFDAAGTFDRAREATDREELQPVFEELFVNLAEEQPYVMLLFSDSIIGYNPDLVGPIENFANGWDFPAWHFEG